MENLNLQIDFLINYLSSEISEEININQLNFKNKFDIYKSLCNIRKPEKVSNEYLKKEKQFFQEFNKNRNIQTIDKIIPLSKKYTNLKTQKYLNILSLWQGDITTLKVDAIVNAANSQGLGCFCPTHICIDNLIHTYAGVALRLECNEAMKTINYYLETGKAIITSGQNLPAKNVIHTVGPIIQDTVTKSKIEDLINCYTNCLKLAKENNLKSIAFPCISTGLFRFPQDLACEIAIKTVIKFLNENGPIFDKIIFNVYLDKDKYIYEDYIQSNL
ncbi:A1pp-domain-containing protein [Anaeromyces robustus]|uniref:A1pp-domain-containing protein n=1 Tax=Anaeromyces robustus TaxID=1754192 RepID=A0A1Y1XQ52_9FUNG|nr:A1pp-domain-containing protein [Anaeromyces robustus]|eukprot:ORX87444.1 A1pp-domain-containing protein [Anaeromyces robustus]